MRSLRKAALAGATAAAVAFGSISVASAQEEPKDNNSSVTQQDSSQNEGSDSEGSTGGSLSSQINKGLGLDGDQPADGTKIFGSEKDLSSQPAWAQALYALLIIGGIGSLVGLVLGPLDNFIKYGPFAN